MKTHSACAPLAEATSGRLKKSGCSQAPQRPDTVRVSITEAEDLSPARLRLAFCALARLMVQAYRQEGDPVAIVRGGRPTSDLTVVPDPSAHHGDEAA